MENKQCQTDIYSLSIMTERNQALAATVYRPKNKVKKAVMLAPATGIKRQFYHNFATHLAENGFGVLTFDNEGIGESLSSALAKCDASLISWGRHDMPAALDALQDEFSDATYHLIGHSAGGQLIGLMPNYSALASVFNVACSSGRIKNMSMPYKLKAMGFMDAFIPLANLTLGYTPSDKLVWANRYHGACLGSGANGVMAQAISKQPLAKVYKRTFMMTLLCHHYGWGLVMMTLPIAKIWMI
ncbi:alpha/beta fold hydrolase [Psychrobacter sp. WY6]|uniref:alpha/beta hydrolase family protein n=1 Tax=Psychrobacter sp. WY6 TaxID=2708350 RepID=UPI002022D039|nr:alpha/beta fold hydrolase [Psychrobacter sp. WY6]